MASRRVLAVAAPVAIGIFVAAIVCTHGIPVLRHDWGFPIAHDALAPAVASLFQPWLSLGIGEAQPDPTFYLVGFALYPMAFLPPTWFVALLVAIAAAVSAAGGAAVGRAVGVGTATPLACAFFAALNPWVYTEFVAGHVFMILAYGLLLLLAAQMLRGQPNRAWLVALSALLVCQIEFFCVAVVPVAGWLSAQRERRAFAALVVAAAPVAFGIATHYAELRGVPYILEWQRIESVPLQAAMILRGYSAAYDATFDPFIAILWAVTLSSLIAIAIAVWTRRILAAAIIVLAWLSIAATSGTTWIFGGMYSAIVIRFTESGVFRELYDLLAFAAVGFCVSIGIVGSRNRAAGYAALVVCAALAVPWMLREPSSFFAPQRSVTPMAFPGTSQWRVALFPASQPVHLAFGPAGYDPDLFIQRGRATPLNTFFPQYPEITALTLARHGDATQLKALGARYVISRPYLHEPPPSIGQPIAASGTDPQSTTLASAFPELGLIDEKPDTVSIGQRSSGNAVFFGDALNRDVGSERAYFIPIAAPRLSADPTTAWIDARLAFVRRPGIATRFGGAYTSARKVPLSIPGGPFALAWTSHAIRDARGATIATASARLSWVPLRGASTLTCDGECAIVGVGDPGPRRPAEGPDITPRAVSFTRIGPWLVAGAVPAHAASTLRFAERYQSSWTLVGIPATSHLRLAQDLNAWILGPGEASRFVIVNTAAAAQFVMEIVSSIVILTLAVYPRRYGGRRTS